MKSITIDKLSIRNFKGCGSLDLDFGGKDAAIYGDNATGKTTVYDALTWLLFGKDSRVQTIDELLKPLDETGAVKDHEAVTTVEAVLTVCDGTEEAEERSTTSSGPSGHLPLEGKAVCLRKELREVWTARRGSTQLLYGGNTVDYFVDGIPIQKKGYTARIEELVEEDTFRLLTSVSAFAADLHWQKRRAVLADMSGAGELSDKAMLQEAVREENRQAEEDPDPRAAAEAGERADRFSALLDDLDGRSLEDEKKILQRMQKDLKNAKTQTPARIDELTIQKTKMAALDFERAEAELRTAQEEAQQARDALAAARNGYSPELQAKLDALQERQKEIDREAEAERMQTDKEVDAARLEMDKLKADNLAARLAHGEEKQRAQDELTELLNKNREWRYKQEIRLPDPQALRREADDLIRSVDYWKDLAKAQEAEAAASEIRLEELRKEWGIVSSQAFSGGTCPTCGQELPMELMQKALEQFENEKVKRLDAIQRDAERAKDHTARRRQEAETSRAEAENRRQLLAETNKKLEAALAAPGEIRDLEGYAEKKAELEGRLRELRSTDGTLPDYAEKVNALAIRLNELKTEPYSIGLIRKQEALNEDISHVRAEKALEEGKARERVDALSRLVQEAEQRQEASNNILGQKLVLEYTRKRIEALREEQKKAAAELERVEALLYAIEDFVRWKTRFVEDTINGMFRMVKFRLFREQANGGVAECCDVTVDGVPYAAVNNGARINAGLDIIRRLSEHFGVRVPLFVDNAEAVTRLEDADTQVIRLIVSEQDKSLRIEI